MEPSVFKARRERLLERLGASVLVLPAAPVFRRNGDADHRYRQESDYLYLTGFDEPQSVIVLAPHQAKRFSLFVRPRDKEMEIWNGRRAGVEGAVRDVGADQAFEIGQLEKELPRLLVGATSVHYPLGLDPAFDRTFVPMLTELRARHRGPSPVPTAIHDLGALLHLLRLVKSPEEVAALREVSTLTRRGFEAAMRATRPGAREYEIEAELLYAYRKGGGDGPGYEPIVASGVNATILHYRTGRDELRDGELLLVDSGCEKDGYTADVTRTWPVGREFSREQQALYEVVLAAHGDAIRAVRPGTSREQVHETACRTLIRGLVDLGLLEGSVDAIWQDKSFRRFYMHGTSHWLGLDVHDAGGYSAAGAPRPLAPGFVLTVEPGLYVASDDAKVDEKWRGIGIRIEDDVLVTKDGGEVLTNDIPRTIEDMRRLRRG